MIWLIFCDFNSNLTWNMCQGNRLHFSGKEKQKKWVTYGKWLEINGTKILLVSFRCLFILFDSDLVSRRGKWLYHAHIWIWYLNIACVIMVAKVMHIYSTNLKSTISITCFVYSVDEVYMNCPIFVFVNLFIEISTYS